jgi:16S rRNA G527 N7-methylase RsmG
VWSSRTLRGLSWLQAVRGQGPVKEVEVVAGRPAAFRRVLEQRDVVLARALSGTLDCALIAGNELLVPLPPTVPPRPPTSARVKLRNH